MSTVSRRSRQRGRGLGPEDWQAWSAQLSQREQPATPWQQISADRSWPLAWALEHIPTADSGSRELISDLGRWAEKHKRPGSGHYAKLLERWLLAADQRRREPAFGLQCLAWTYILPGLASELPAAVGCDALELLTSAATSMPDLNLDADPLSHQWLAGELPLTLAYQFPDLDSCRSLAAAAGKAITAGIKTLLDGDGLPAAHRLDLVRPLLACWTRCLKLAWAANLQCLDKNATTHFEWFVRRALQLTRETGTPVFSSVSFGADEAAMFEAALSLIDDPEDWAIADQVLPGREAKRRASQKQVLFPAAAANTDWGRLSILRPNWLRGGPQLILAHQDGRMRTELNCGQQTIWSGDWELEITVDGRRLRGPSDWEHVCWHTDDDVDYLELQTDCGQGWTLQRQIVLAREDLILFAGDALLGPASGRIEYRTALPLSPPIRFDSAQETTEGRLAGRDPLALVLPLGLGEWRTAHNQGCLEAADGSLQLTQTAVGQRLYVPWLIDLDAKRVKRPATWRQLTVGERLEIVPADQAVAYRAQIGQQQWLFYRSLGEPGNRTVLGQNLCNEFLAASFDREGDVEDLIRIDSE